MATSNSLNPIKREIGRQIRWYAEKLAQEQAAAEKVEEVKWEFSELTDEQIDRFLDIADQKVWTDEALAFVGEIQTLVEASTTRRTALEDHLIEKLGGGAIRRRGALNIAELVRLLNRLDRNDTKEIEKFFIEKDLIKLRFKPAEVTS
jgi:hypothetical protein